MHRNATRTLLAAAASLVLVGCDSDGGDGENPQALELNVYTSSTASNPFEDVAFMVLEVVGDGLGSGVTEVVPYEPGGSGTIPSVPFGSADGKRQVIVEGWAATPQGELSHAVSRGRSVSTRVDASQPRELPVLLARINSFLPLPDAVSRQAQALEQGRLGHTATRTSAGEVVIAGGGAVADGGAWWRPEGFTLVLPQVEVVEERSGLRQAHPGGLPFPRVWHTATAIPNGDVLFAGGWSADGAAHAEVAWYRRSVDGQILQLSPSVQLSAARAGHTATLVEPETFTILFVGGDAEGTWELWRPSEGTIASGALPDGPRRFHAATYFEVPATAGAAPRPAVLIAGGENDEGTLASAAVYDVKSRTMVPQLGGLAKGGRTMLTGTWVPGQSKIYLVGGFPDVDRGAASNAIDVYDTNATNPAAAFRDDVGGFNLARARGAHTATLMGESSVLLAGGAASDGSARSSIEIIHQYFKEETDPSTGKATLRPFITVAFACDDPGCPDVPDLPVARFGHAAVLLDTGMVLLTGGVAGGGAAALSHVLDLTLYNPR